MRGRVCTIKLYWTVLSVQWVVMFAYQATAIEYGNQTAAGHEKRFSSYSCLSRKLTGANNNINDGSRIFKPSCVTMTV